MAYNVRDDANILLAIAYTYAALHHSPTLLLQLPSSAREVVTHHGDVCVRVVSAGTIALCMSSSTPRA